MKRRIKMNQYGNWNGYLGRRRVQEFGTDYMAAAYWFLTGIVDFSEAYSSEWYTKCRDLLKTL